MSDYDSMWYWWRRLQDEHPTTVAARGARADSTSPHYRPTTPPEPSPLSTPVSPLTPTGPSAVGSASFDIRWLRPSSARGSPSKPEATADTHSSPTPSEMQVDPQEISPEDARAITEVIAADEPAPVLRPRPDRSTVRGRKTTRGKAPSAPPTSVTNADPQGRPMIHVRSSRKSSTPPAEEAHNEGEEVREDNEDEDVMLPRKHKRTETRASKGKGKAKSGTPAPSSRFPAVVRKTRGNSKKDELPAYVPPRPVPTMDTIRLAAESLAKEWSESTVFDAGCSNCVFRNRECEHGKPGTLCDHCKKGRLSHCTHTFTVPEHVQAANHIEPYAHPSNQRGNKLLFDLSATRVDYELAHESLFRASSCLAVTSNRVGAWICKVTASLGADGLPGMDEIPDELQPLWGQLLLDSQAQMTVDYRTAIMQYPFLSDTRHTESTSNDELQELLNILARRAARNQQSTPPPVESSNWPEEDESGPSGSK
ncbi:hypothetical protein DFH08DRAFT_819795 [Mycena albidolilacea]|uniref:Zn(2)-C6 fungal-type domain-containing protein n=1 Tax=Mycena albidolilacea TaxID=1033008 RepID=A0AAD6ZDY7_9AGAR|nr:hypothetical protein DFH08DRAFT_819795 [Mycena albidolilacea]